MATGKIEMPMKYKDFSGNLSVSAGTSGTYVTNVSFDCSLTGLTPVIAQLIKFGHPGQASLLPTIENNILNVYIYRAASTAGSWSNDWTFRVYYQ